MCRQSGPPCHAERVEHGTPDDDLVAEIDGLVTDADVWTGDLGIPRFAAVGGALAVGAQHIAFALAVGFIAPTLILVGLLATTIACPNCGHSIVLPARPMVRPFEPYLAIPSRRCRKCGNSLDSSG
jgi:hypothetical protein